MATNATDHIGIEEEREGSEALGIETERPDPTGAAIGIERPFDPDKIKVARESKTISLLTTRIDHGEIDLAPEFQRRARIWDNGRKSRLIESILLRIPLPVFYVASDMQETWAVVDGLQRLTTIHDFMNGAFGLSGLEYLVQFNGNRFSELPRSMQRRIEETELVINIIQPGTPEEVMFNIFSRINTGGLTLNGQEIRHALNKGPARSFLKDLAQSRSFLRATSESVSDTRMAGRECALRFLAFRLTDWREYSTNDLDGFLNAAMQRLNNLSTQELRELRADFDRSMETATAIFQNDAFRKRYDVDAPRNPISKALFEAWSVTFAGLTDDERSALVSRRNVVKRSFIDLMVNDREFEVAVSYSTGSPGRVHKRFLAIEQLVVEVLSA
ncbi:DUF262 domain-containing protein [Sphingomonas sp. MJ1 (PH-R8)]|uniref:DUF262 domain-containing protein n=1 Tax=Sphingomonas sp. MJ1 (PH-R8) TaxID=3112950 RepID=UPI003A87DC17